MRFILTCVILFFSCTAWSQDGFEFGKIDLKDLLAKGYPLDTTANAIVLDEYGYGFIDVAEGKLIFEYHVKIKVLKKAGVEEGNFQIPLRKSEGSIEIVNDLKASTYNVIDNVVKEVKMNAKAVFTENRSKYYDLKKFTLPDVQVGSVLEVMYLLESPFLFNFYPWEFQSSLPKIRSEFKAKIPGNYVYNIVLKGPLKLSKNETSVINSCFQFGTGKADCAVFNFAMVNIPPFKDEKYMTAKSNFLSALNFELSEVKHFDGQVHKYTQEWKDVDRQLIANEDFGLQIKKGRNQLEKEMKSLVANEKDELGKAKAIYKSITTKYKWNETLGKYAEGGAKKTIETKTGNVGDINLLLISALQSADLKVEPVILSTRSNGLPITLHPVLSDFNYVVAMVTIGQDKYLVDATEKYFPFGLLPERCLNGKGRLIGDNPGWVDLKPRGKEKESTVLNLALDSTGMFRGQLIIIHYGYNAAEKRAKILEFADQKAYTDKLEADWRKITINKYEVSGLENPEEDLKEVMDIEIKAFDDLSVDRYYLDPFFTGKYSDNPFKATERLFPIDFGAPLEKSLVINLSFPEKINLESTPDNAAMVLPAGGGRFLFNVTTQTNRVNISSALLLNKTVYDPAEYKMLKELFDRMIQAQQSILVFDKK